MNTDKYTVRNDLKECFRRNLHVPLIFVVLHVLLSLAFSFEADFYGGIPLYGFMGLFLPVVQVMYVIGGIAFGMRSFSFFVKKKEMNVFLSLPIRRKELLKNRVITGVVYSFIAALLPVVFTITVNKIFFTVDKNDLLLMVVLTIGMFAAMLLGFSLGSVFSVYTGKNSETVIFSLLLCILPTLLFAAVWNILTTINGNMLGVYVHSIPVLTTESIGVLYINPTFNMITMIDLVDAEFSGKVTSEHFILVLVNLLVSVIPFLLLPRVVRNRKAEKSDFSITHKKVALTIAFFVSFICFGIINAFYSISNRAIVAPIAIFVSLAVFILIPALIFRNKSKIKACLKLLPVPLALFAVIYLVCMTGVFGHFNRVPDVNEIEGCYLMPICYDEFLSPNKDEIFVEEQIVYGPFSTDKDKEKITSIHSAVTDDLGKGDSDIFVAYKLKNGKIFGRYYRGVTDEAALETLGFVETDMYQNMVNNVLDSVKFKVMKTRYYYLTNDESYYDYGRFNMENARVLTFEEYHERSLLSEIMNFDHPMSLLNRSASDGFFLSDRLTEEQIEQFKKCIAEDYRNITVQKMFFPTEQAEYILRFDEDYTLDWYDDTEIKMSNPSEYDTEYTGAEIAIYPWMTKTMAFIAENDMTVKQLTAEDVSCIFSVSVDQAIKNYTADLYSPEDFMPVQQIFAHHWRDEYYEAVSTFSLYDKKITDKAEIEQYLDSYMSSYCYFAQDGEMVMFKLEDNSRFYAFVPKK